MGFADDNEELKCLSTQKNFGSHSVFPPKIWRDFILKTPYTGGRG